MSIPTTPIAPARTGMRAGVGEACPRHSWADTVRIWLALHQQQRKMTTRSQAVFSVTLWWVMLYMVK